MTDSTYRNMDNFKTYTTRSIYNMLTDTSYTKIIVFWFIAIFPLFIPNNGGTGLALPQNLLTWMLMLILSGLVFYRTKQPLIITPTWCWAAAGTLVLAVPLFYTRSEWLPAALWRHAGLTGGLLFWLAGLQINWSIAQRRWVIHAILLATVIQTLLALWQTLTLTQFPYPLAIPVARSGGVFQQVNVLASFCAVGLGLALGIFLTPVYRFSVSQAPYQSVTGAVLFILSAGLVWQQSRTGWLAEILICFAAVVRFRLYPRQLALAFIIMFSGGACAALLMYKGIGVPVISHAGSNLARMSMYRDALAMTIQKFWTGWGYGGFEFNFQHFRLAQRPDEYITEIARHPHNELLYWLVDGGAVAGIGLLLLFLSAGNLIQQVTRFRSSQYVCFPLGLALIPLLLHSQTEYPFYLSTTHWLLFILFITLLDRLTIPATSLVALPRVSSRSICFILFALTVSVAAGGLIPAFNSHLALTDFERQGWHRTGESERAMRYDRFINTERWAYDLHTHNLLAFNLTRDAKVLEDYQLWAQNYLKTRIDRNVYANLVLIERAQGKTELAEQHRREVSYLFPNDSRFITPSSVDTSWKSLD
ncbi:O-antigen polymerase [Enterobacter cancerogenus]|uniref:O-antigen polymerase n=1 Tax=Enterobacter cancerogenus TaxID=69218 RepID=A0A484WXQ6_9ENTR|nr:O-antigen polymerase [Enterobacter cancerogenus]HDX4396352.1 O-antigen ligase C-terminal domain-containing protein [Enterobacter bugandensis]